MAGEAVQTATPDAELDPQRWRERLAACWPEFLGRRQTRIRTGGAVTDAITRDLLGAVVLWQPDAMTPAPGPGLVLAASGERCYLALAPPGAIPARRPGLCPAARRAAGYARAQRLPHWGLCDSGVLYVEDCNGCAGRERLRVWLGQSPPPGELWWATPWGLRLRRTPPQAAFAWDPPQAAAQPGTRLHPQLGLPARCFAYVGDGPDVRSWKLPYLRADGEPDPPRLAAAVARVTGAGPGRRLGVPELELGVVIRRLAAAARRLGQLPPQCERPHPALLRLAAAERALSVSRAAAAERLGQTAALAPLHNDGPGPLAADRQRVER